MEIKRLERKIVPIIISLICFAYSINFLIRYGEMFPRGSDVVSNTAYGLTMFGDSYHAGWSVPKPSQMILFGLTYRITGSLWFVNALFVVAAALLIYYTCRIMDKSYGVPIPFLVFAVLVMMMPFFFGATLGGGSGLLNTMFLLIALAYIRDLSRLRNRIMVIVFLSAASLTRPDNWANTYLIVFCIFALKYFPRNRPQFDRADLLFLIPLFMPAVWHIMDYFVFGNVFYSRWLAQRFAIEYSNRSKVFDWHKYPGLVKSAFFSAFYLSAWLSVRTLILIALSVTGIVTMFIKQRRILLFMACPFLGTIVFYLATYVRGMLFMNRFLFYNYVFIIFAVSVGIAQLGIFVLYLPVRYLRNILQVALTCLIVLFIVYVPFKTKIVDSMLPGLKARSTVVKRESKAVRSIENDLSSGDNPVIMANLSIATSRIALRVRTGKDIYLLERLVGLEKLGVQDFLPDMKNRTVYLAYGKSVKGGVKNLIQRIEEEAVKIETIFDEDGLKISKRL